jgi:hypothetical protein
MWQCLARNNVAEKPSPFCIAFGLHWCGAKIYGSVDATRTGERLYGRTAEPVAERDRNTVTLMKRLLVFSPIVFSLLAQDAQLEHARQVNLERAASMPNFVADEISKRYVSKAGSSKWQYLDTIESEIAVQGTQLMRQNMRRNGKPWNRGDSGFGFLPSTGFGAELKPLFHPECPTRLEFGSREGTGGKPVLVYRFSSPPNGCFSVLFSGDREPYNPARTGRVSVDESTGRVVGFEEEATGFPKDYGFVQRNQVVSWGSVKTEGGSVWLPAGAEFVWRLPTGLRYRVVAEYRNHRHFEAVTTLSFSGPPAPGASSPAKPLD